MGPTFSDLFFTPGKPQIAKKTLFANTSQISNLGSFFSKLVIEGWIGTPPREVPKELCDILTRYKQEY